MLLVYGTTEGQTRKVAAFMADRLAGLGHSALTVDCTEVPPSLDLAGFDAVLVAASVHAGRYQSSVVHFVNEHGAALDARPNAFISVSLSAASDEPEEVEGLRECVGEFVADTGWTPRRIHHVAGAFRYTAYDFFKRWALKYIAYRKGAPTDTHRDHELTDWDDLRRFVDSFVDGAGAAA
jgi:menaquinone-dependent protoporphyrinogen oxidase